MRQLTADHLNELLGEHEPPCISLYQPTHRHHPDNQQDPIRFRNLLGEMENSLRQQYPTWEVPSLLENFQALARDDRFWNHRTDGLAILSSPDKFQIFELQRTVPELLVVADSFHTKPLLRILQSADRYQVLCLNQHEAKLYEGNRDGLDPVELTDFPSTITEALGEELTEPHQTVASYGKGSHGPQAGPHGAPAMYHGHGQKRDEVDIDRDRFFRAIDRAILEHHSRPSGLPLLLAALTEFHEPFHKISHNPFLMGEGITMNTEALSPERLCALAWQKVEPLYLERLAKLVDSYQIARSRQLGSDDLVQVAEAAAAGRVGTLLVEADRQIPGRIDAATGQVERGKDLSQPRATMPKSYKSPVPGEIEPDDLAHPETDDILDDLAEKVLRMKGVVVVVPKERMPSGTGLAATYRF